MDCRTARRLVWPPERPQLAGEDIVRARTHVAACAECSAYLEQDRRLLRLYDRARQTTAPAEVREHVFDAIAGIRWARTRDLEGVTPPRVDVTSIEGPPKREQRRFGATARGLWPLAAVASVVVIGLVYPRATTSPPEDPDVFVEDYLRRAVGADHIETDDPAEVRRFLERELGLSFDPIRFPGLVLSRAEICLLEGRRGAMIVYRSEGAMVSHYLIPRRDAPARSPSLSAREEGSGYDMPVVTWATKDVEQALVGEVGADRLLAIAEAGVARTSTSVVRPAGTS